MCKVFWQPLHCLQVLCNSTPHLPLEVLAGLLQSVQQRDRLGNCALVIKGWRQAANMATTDLYCSAGREGYDSLLAWLNNNEYASQVLRMYVMADHGDPMRPTLQLPANRLGQLNTLKLELNRLEVIDAPSSTKVTFTASTAAAATSCGGTTTHDTPAAPGARTVAALTALTRLQLDTCHLDLSELSCCTGLRDLFAWNVSHTARLRPTTCRGKKYVRARSRSASSAEDAASSDDEAASEAKAGQASSDDFSGLSMRMFQKEEQWGPTEDAAEDGEAGASLVS